MFDFKKSLLLANLWSCLQLNRRNQRCLTRRTPTSYNIHQRQCCVVRYFEKNLQQEENHNILFTSTRVGVIGSEVVAWLVNLRSCLPPPETSLISGLGYQLAMANEPPRNLKFTISKTLWHTSTSFLSDCKWSVIWFFCQPSGLNCPDLLFLSWTGIIWCPCCSNTLLMLFSVLVSFHLFIHSPFCSFLLDVFLWAK